MRIVEAATISTFKYKDIKNSFDLYHYCYEENILIGKDRYNKPYAIFLNNNNKVIRNITFNNSNYKWRVCWLTNNGVKFLRKNGLLKDCYM